MRKQFDEELDKLNLDLSKMGHLVELSIENMIDVFKHQDKKKAKDMIRNDRMINDMERSIESRAFNLMLTQQPIASDLRNITSALKVVTDLERIGDQSADIAEILLSLDVVHPYKTVEHIPLMAKQTKLMVHEAIDAFIHKDLSAAMLVKKMDDDIDHLFDEVKSEVIMIIKENGERIDHCLDFLMIAKYLERIGDHAVNICEWLEFDQIGSVNEQQLI